MTRTVANCVHGGMAYAFWGSRFEALSAAKVVNADVLDAWYSPAPSVEQILSERGIWGTRNSPPLRCDGLRAAIAEARGLRESNLLLGHGSSDLIFRILPALFSEKSLLVMPRPQYGEYYHVLHELYGHNIVEIDGNVDEGFRISPDELIKVVLRHSAQALILVNPCNPTGQVICRSDLLFVLESLPRSTLLIVDETYIDYTPDESLEPLVAQYANLIVFKSMSKIFALSGARVAYAVVPCHLCSRLDRFTPPYVISTLGQMAALAALGEPDYYKLKLEQTRERRLFLHNGLQKIRGCVPLPSCGNFLVVDIAGTGQTSHHLANALLQRHVCVREMHSFRMTDASRFLRMTVLDYADIKILLTALSDIVERL